MISMKVITGWRTKMETKLLNDTAVCPECGFEYLPEYQYYKDSEVCDNCIEHEIDRVYGERGDPWEDFGKYNEGSYDGDDDQK